MDSAPNRPPASESSIEAEWSWYGHTPAEPFPAVSRYVNVCPGLTLPPLPENSGSHTPSEAGLYSTPWKCIEWGWLRRVSMFLKWMRSSSPTRARISGPGMRPTPAPRS